MYVFFKLIIVTVLYQQLVAFLTQYVRGLKNFRAEQPHQHAIYYTNILSSEQLWTKEELLEATEGLLSIPVEHAEL